MSNKICEHCNGEGASVLALGAYLHLAWAHPECNEKYGFTISEEVKEAYEDAENRNV